MSFFSYAIDISYPWLYYISFCLLWELLIMQTTSRVAKRCSLCKLHRVWPKYAFFHITAAGFQAEDWLQRRIIKYQKYEWVNSNKWSITNNYILRLQIRFWYCTCIKMSHKQRQSLEGEWIMHVLTGYQLITLQPCTGCVAKSYKEGYFCAP